MDCIISFSGPSTSDGFGVAWSAYSAADFLASFGVPPTILADPGKAAGNNVQLAQWSADIKAYNAQQLNLGTVRQALLNSVPVHHLRPMEVQRSLRTRTVEYICTELRRTLDTLSVQDYDALKVALRVKYVHPGHIDEFLSLKQQTLADLVTAGQTVAAADAVTII